jgi:O-antigen ligase
VQTFRSIQLWATTAALTLAPLFFGSVDQFWIALWTVVLSVGTFCGAARQINIRQRRILFAFVSVCIIYALVAVAQIVPDFITGIGDPIWNRASDLLEMKLPTRISSRAEIPPVAVGHFLLLITAFMSGFFVGTSREDSDFLTAIARYSILLYAIYGLLALVFTPNMLLWAPKTAYRGSLTATFVNHNTAATFVGVGAIMWLCSALETLQSLRFSSLRLLLLIPSNELLAFKLILRSAAGLTCLFALLLTGSRGGLICSSIGLLVAVGLIIASKVRLGFWYITGSAAGALAVTLGWLMQTGRIGSEGLLDYGRWSVYEYCIDVIRQRPLLGTGAGTFGDVFPSVRGADLSAWGVWDYAHSTILEIAVEMGIPVAFMIGVAAVASVFVLLRAALRSEDRSRSSFSVMAGVAVLTYLHSMIDFSLQIPGYLVVFWILLGCWMARSFEKPNLRARTRGSMAAPSIGEVQEPIGAAVS